MVARKVTDPTTPEPAGEHVTAEREQRRDPLGIVLTRAALVGEVDDVEHVVEQVAADHALGVLAEQRGGRTRHCGHPTTVVDDQAGIS